MADAPPFIRVIDFETTGLKPPPEGSGICEVGWCDVHLDEGGAARVGEPDAILTNPGCPIPATASAVHHITDLMVANAPLAATVLREVFEPEVPKAAHYMRFDRQFYDPGGDFICTCKVARRLWPHAPGFGNQDLRYWIGLELDPEYWRPAHRARGDAYVTASLLAQVISEGASVPELLEWSVEAVLLSTCRYEKHAGKPWAEVDEGFLRWLLNKEADKPGSFDPDEVYTARHYLKRAEQGETE